MMKTIEDMTEEDRINWLKILNDREAKMLQEFQEIRKKRSIIIKEMKRQSINRKLTRHQAADLLEYNYYYMSRLDIPFKDSKIYYLDLLEWIKENKPARIKRLEKNFKAFLNENSKS